MRQVLISFAFILLVSVSAIATPKNADTEKSLDSATKQIDSVPGKKDPVIEMPKQKTEKSSNLPVSNSSESDNLYLVFGGGLLLIFLLCFVIWLKINKLVEENKKMADEINRLPSTFEKKVTGLIKNIMDDVKFLREEVSYLKKEIVQLKTKGSEQHSSEKSSAPPSQNIQPQVPPSVPEVPKEIFYFRSVVTDGSGNGFFDKKFSNKEFVENESLYRFEMKPGETKANFFVEDKPSVLREFLNNPQTQDLAVEELKEYQYNDKAKRLETAKSGSAVLDGDKWRVKEKVKVKYIV